MIMKKITMGLLTTLTTLMLSGGTFTTQTHAATIAHSAYVKLVNSTIQSIYRGLQAHKTDIVLNEPHFSTFEVENEFVDGVYENAETINPYYMLMIKSTTPMILQNYEVAYHVTWRETPAQVHAVQKQIQKVLKKIIKPDMDVYTKEKAINDYIANNVSPKTIPNSTAYYALFTHQGDCQGISELAYQMFNAAGIPAKIIVGDVYGQNGTNKISYPLEYGQSFSIQPSPNFFGVNHAWNEVELNGKWYQLDITLDNPVGRPSGEMMYDFYNLTSSKMAITHSWNKNFNNSNLPVADTYFLYVLKRSKSKQDQQILKQITTRNVFI
jgi:transglutaminase/protease-like cytokinesis protein 3